MTSNHHALMIWATRATMDNKGSETARSSKSHKVVLSSDCSLQLDYEAGIASNRRSACYGEYVPGLVHTARHTREFVTPEAGGVTI